MNKSEELLKSIKSESKIDEGYSFKLYSGSEMDVDIVEKKLQVYMEISHPGGDFKTPISEIKDLDALKRLMITKGKDKSKKIKEGFKELEDLFDWIASLGAEEV